VTNDKNRGLQDLTWREIGLIAPLLVLMVYMGVYPKPFLKKTEEPVKALQERVMHQAGGTVPEVEHK
jgi:NADH-quinone oxidoreductase subunit M